MLSQNAQNLINQRYTLFDGETWEEIVTRNMDHIIGKKGKLYDFMHFAMLERIFLPNSPCIVNAGKDKAGLFACFTVGPEEDTLEDSFNTLTDIALVAKRGGGCGFSGSILRPKNSPVAGSTHGYAYGPNRFAELVSYAMDAITQAGFRKMALMYTLSAEHPDIEDFLTLKQTGDETACYNFNQSVFMKDDYMRRALSNPGGVEDHLLDSVAKHAWANGEPGLLFEDTINKKSPYSYTGQKIVTTNPCGEQPLPNYGSCNLGSINVNHEWLNPNGTFSFSRLRQVTRYAIEYLDLVGTVNVFPTKKHKDWYEQNRPVGLDIMGFADLLLRNKIAYGSEESIKLISDIYEDMLNTALETSETLAKYLGTPEACRLLPVPRRNITLLTGAPTGSRAIIADCSHSIEPIFSETFTRVDERGAVYKYQHPEAKEDYFVTAVGDKQATWKEQIDLVAAMQKYVDSGVSKTINFPNEATKKDIKDAMIYAWQFGCKGITVYRNGSRDFQVLNADTAECATGVCEI